MVGEGHSMECQKLPRQSGFGKAEAELLVGSADLAALSQSWVLVLLADYSPCPKPTGEQNWSKLINV